MGNTIVRTTFVDGHLVEIAKDGTQRPLPTPPSVREMTEEEIMAAALSDPDAQPLTGEKLKSMRRVPRVKTLRYTLMLTQEEFAARFAIPLGTLRDWEQGRTEPDATAKAYLKVIAEEPEIVAGALVRKTAA
jgi:putative transcriptional regulator